ncbi:uncharacterized protein SRS1_12625 [Sporisorium reilianum f. sp. reilianum]|uniref:ER membrane protein complex subunit 10 n=1 Tax=Sporisorium reilianum f. sp. reilianum TaxID=72559 RepID=A0A2N8UA26_9BASI|nr:uncharacterized protein SRS1_12625 [Sporisorium reilianum f. sp. reilianum]
MKLLSVLSAAVALSTLPLATASTTYNVLHRVASFSSSPDWTVRGTLELDNATSVYSNTLAAAEVAALHARAALPEASGLFYQLALTPTSSQGAVEEDGMWTSVRLCHLRQSHADLPTIDDELTLTLRNDHVLALHYRIRDITLDSHSCPLPTKHKWNQVQDEQRKARQRQLARRRGSKPAPAPPAQQAGVQFSTLVHIAAAHKAAKVVLKQAAPTNEDGTIQVPPPEKTFVQKYWFYAIPIALLLIMPDGQDERAGGAEAHASSEHRGTGMGAKRLN